MNSVTTPRKDWILCVVLNERRVHFHRCEKKCHIGVYKFRFLYQKLLKIFLKLFIFMKLTQLRYTLIDFLLTSDPKCRWVRSEKREKLM